MIYEAKECRSNRVKRCMYTVVNQKLVLAISC